MTIEVVYSTKIVPASVEKPFPLAPSFEIKYGQNSRTAGLELPPGARVVNIVHLNSYEAIVYWVQDELSMQEKYEIEKKEQKKKELEARPV